MLSQWLSLLLLLLVVSFDVVRSEHKSTHQGKDGVIRQDATTFKTWDDYWVANPEEFRHHCGTHRPDEADEAAAVAGDRRRRLTASDCSGSFNNPKEIYSPNSGPLYRVKVVVHVVTAGSGTSATGYISPECVANGITLLNNDFRAVAGTKSASSTDTQIEFALASADAAGASTTGIVYYNNETWFNNYHEPQMWANSWPTADYLNIYLKVAKSSNGEIALGFATFPHSSAGTTYGERPLDLVEAIVPSEVGWKCDVASGAAPVQHARRAPDVKERSGDSVRCGPEGCRLSPSLRTKPQRSAAQRETPPPLCRRRGGAVHGVGR